MGMKYKVGDRVRIKSLDWYNENKNENGIVEFSTRVFIPEMLEYCGMIVTIKDFIKDAEGNVVYSMEDIIWGWTDEMIEGLVEEEVKPQYEDEIELIGYSSPKQFICPIGYEFKDENGNVINATKIVLKKKKQTYPKTYEECRRIMGIDTGFLLTSYDIDFCKGHLLTSLQKLLICRDAYWKIAGEEMGLGKPWSPTDSEVCYGIFPWEGEIQHDTTAKWCILTFPTEEMRDAFFNNFKKEIEICKELL